MLKADIRKSYKEKRKFVSPFDLNRFSKSITQLVLDHFDFRNKIVSIFLPIERQKEISTYELMEEIQLSGGTIAVSKSDFTTNTLTHFKFENALQLEVNSFGIPEPKYGETVFEVQLDYVFVPLLAIDAYGNRVGYGKGFYDKLLTACHPNCIFIGLHLFEELIEIDDLHSGDIPLHYCVTPTQIHDFRR